MCNTLNKGCGQLRNSTELTPVVAAISLSVILQKRKRQKRNKRIGTPNHTHHKDSRRYLLGPCPGLKVLVEPPFNCHQAPNTVYILKFLDLYLYLQYMGPSCDSFSRLTPKGFSHFHPGVPVGLLQCLLHC